MEDCLSFIGEQDEGPTIQGPLDEEPLPALRVARPVDGAGVDNGRGELILA